MASGESISLHISNHIIKTYTNIFWVSEVNEIRPTIRPTTEPEREKVCVRERDIERERHSERGQTDRCR